MGIRAVCLAAFLVCTGLAPAFAAFAQSVGGDAQVPGQSDTAPVVITEEITVTAPRTFRNLADVPNPTESLIGLADAASEGAITARQLDARLFLRPGEVLETIPGLVIRSVSTAVKARPISTTCADSISITAPTSP